MGGGSPSPSPSPVGSPCGNNIEGALTNAFNNCRIQPSDPVSGGGGGAMPTSFRGHSPFYYGFPSPHHKHKLKCHLKIKHKHHGHLKIKHKHHEHLKIKCEHHEHKHGGEKEKHRLPHCHHMGFEAPLGYRFHHHGPHHHGPRPHPRGHSHHHHMKQKHYGHCCSPGYQRFSTHPMGGPVPVPVPTPHN